MSSSIPDRWLEYKAYGDAIKRIGILAFKVPLKEGINKNLQPDQRFTTAILLEAFPQLKYIIDLSNTGRYYDKKEFTDAGVRYEKIMVPGRNLPTMDSVKKFFKVMDDFISSRAEGEIIGVHCTHGINRTGYLICRYLVQQLGWELDESLKAFEEARGYQIERDTYLTALKEVPRGEKIDTSKVTLTSIDSIPVKKIPVKSNSNSKQKSFPMGPPGFGPRRGFANGGPFPPPQAFGFGGPSPGFGPMPPPPPGMPPGMPRPTGGPPMCGPRPMRMGPPPMRPVMPPLRPPVMPPHPMGPGFPGPGFPPRMQGPPRMPGPPRLPAPPVRLPPPRMPPPPPPTPSPRSGVAKRLQTQKKKQMRNGVVMPARNPLRMTRRDGGVQVSRILPKVLKEQDFTVDTFEENLLAAGSNAVQSRRQNKGRFNQTK